MKALLLLLITCIAIVGSSSGIAFVLANLIHPAWGFLIFPVWFIAAMLGGCFVAAVCSDLSR